MDTLFFFTLMSITCEAEYKSTSGQIRMRAIPPVSDSPFVTLTYLWEVLMYLNYSGKKKNKKTVNALPRREDSVVISL